MKDTLILIAYKLLVVCKNFVGNFYLVRAYCHRCGRVRYQYQIPTYIDSPEFPYVCYECFCYYHPEYKWKLVQVKSLAKKKEFKIYK
jgi:hypothetical protein